MSSYFAIYTLVGGVVCVAVLGWPSETVMVLVIRKMMTPASLIAVNPSIGAVDRVFEVMRRRWIRSWMFS